MKYKTFLSFIILILCLNFVYGYDNSTLKSYFSLGDGDNSSTLYDTHSGQILSTPHSSTYYAFETNCLQGGCFYQTTTSAFYFTNYTFTGYDNTDLTFNVWIKDINGVSSALNGKYAFGFGTDSTPSYFAYLSVYMNLSNFTRFGLYDTDNSNFYGGDISGGSCCGYLNNQSLYDTNTDNFHMFTVTYDVDTEYFYFYFDGVYQGDYYAANIFTGDDKGLRIYFNNEYSYYDEFSLWYSTLNSSDITTLYNDGSGLNYAETMAGASGTNYTEENPVTYPFYYDYCVGNRLCNVFQTNISSCTDDYSINCLVDCVDYGLGFGGYYYGYCVNDSQVVSYNTQNYYDICIGNILCHNLSVTNGTADCPFTSNGVLNRITCPSTCSDTQLEHLYSSPVGNNYSASCTLCSNECTAENSTQCSDNATLQTCHLTSNGCYRWFDSSCGIFQYCNFLTASCTYYSTSTNASNVPLGTTTQADQDLWSNFFNLDATSATNKLLIALISIILCGVLASGLIFSVSNATGRGLPSFLSVGILSTFLILPIVYFIAIGFIPFWVLIIIIVLIAIILATWIRSSVIGG